jgi:hypothetical protein
MNLIKLLSVLDKKGNQPVIHTRHDNYDECDYESRIIDRLLEEVMPRPHAPALGGQTCVRSIMPYRLHGQWVFDDKSVGLQAEAFVCGMSEILDQLLRDSGIDPKKVRNGFRLTYSPIPFPSHVYAIHWSHAEAGGNVYTCPQNGMIGWLCPALYKYFDKAPERIYFRADLLDEPA